MRPTPEEARELAIAAIEDRERSGLPLVTRVMAAVLAGAGQARETLGDVVPAGWDAPLRDVVRDLKRSAQNARFALWEETEPGSRIRRRVEPELDSAAARATNLEDALR